MLKMKKMTMVTVIMVVVISLLAVMTLTVEATEDNPITLDGLNITIDGGDTTNEQIANEIVANAEAANAQATQIIQPDTNVANTSGNDNTLPQTGVTEDITVMFFIIVCVVSAIYAYKKIRDYNV